MQKYRGIAAFIFSICLGLLAMTAVSHYLNKPVPREVMAVPSKENKLPPPEPDPSVPVGMRRFFIGSDSLADGVPPLKNNERVDVIAVSELPGKASQKLSKLLLQNVRVAEFAVEEKGKPMRKGRPGVTLFLTPEQAVMLSAVTSESVIRLVGRNMDDAANIAVPHTFMDSNGETESITQPSDPPSATTIPAGMRALTISVNATDGICGTVSPGDRVDLIYTSDINRIRLSEQFGEDEKSGKIMGTKRFSRVFLQDIEVLATERSFSGYPNDHIPIKKVTLLLTIADSEKLAVLTHSTEKNLLRIVNRNTEDHANVATTGKTFKETILRKKEKSRVIVISGSKLRERVFYEDENEKEGQNEQNSP